MRTERGVTPQGKRVWARGAQWGPGAKPLVLWFNFLIGYVR